MSKHGHWTEKLAPFVVASCLLFPLVGAFAQLANGHAKFFQLKCAPLEGAGTTDAPAALTWQSWLSSDFQKTADQWFTTNFGARNLLVRLNNELTYRIFNRSYMYSGQILSDDNGILYLAPYVHDYYHQCTDADRKKVTELVSDLSLLQSELQARGMAFTYLITPSKAVIQPPAFNGSSPPPASYRVYHELIKQIEARHVNYIDGHEMTAKLEATGYPPTFTNGGIHWTETSAATSLNAVICNLNNQLKRQAFSTIHIGKPALEKADSVETDLARLMNLYIPFASDPAVHTSFKPACGLIKNSSLVLEGCSFCGQLTAIASKADVAKSMRHYLYFTRALHSWPDGLHKEYFPEDSVNWDSDVLSADAIVLENNEALPFDHNQKFAAKMLKKMKNQAKLAQEGTSL
jgi:hypothetical protein